MNAGVPTAMPVCVSRDPLSAARAIPKSVTFRWPSSATMTFWGFKATGVPKAAYAPVNSAAFTGIEV